jgi:Spy/CpxP family protein refolding chaperone
MTKTLTLWLLGGALAASLAWNARFLGRAAPAGGRASPSGCADLDPAVLGLDQEQRAALERLCARSCVELDRLEGRADELQRELLERLSAAELAREDASALVEEIAALRRRSLETCVQGILEVRALLTPEQLRSLLEQCSAGAQGCRTECAPPAAGPREEGAAGPLPTRPSPTFEE